MKINSQPICGSKSLGIPAGGYPAADGSCLMRPIHFSAKLWNNCPSLLMVILGVAFTATQAVEAFPITHGSQLTAAMVGPGVIAIPACSLF